MHASKLSIYTLPTIHENAISEPHSRRRSIDAPSADGTLPTADHIRTNGYEPAPTLQRTLRGTLSKFAGSTERSPSSGRGASAEAAKHITAAKLFRAATAGTHHASAFGEMTQHITPRRNRPVDPEKAAAAVAWFRKHADTDAAAANNLGVCYLRGRGTDHAAHTGIDMLRSAAIAGSADAEFNLGFAHEHAVGTHYSPALAAQSYEAAAALNHPRAMMRLVLMHNIGNNRLDPARAADLERKAKAAHCFESDYTPDFALSTR